VRTYKGEKKETAEMETTLSTVVGWGFGKGRKVIKGFECHQGQGVRSSREDDRNGDGLLHRWGSPRHV